MRKGAVLFCFIVRQAYNLSTSDFVERNFCVRAGVPASLRSFKPATGDEVIPWDFLSRLEYSLTDSNPRRRIHSDIKEGLEDITREVMASINSCSRQRGRVVEERSALYGYRRVNSYGADTILDLLLVYRKYRGRKVTLPVRRHVYLHQHFTGTTVARRYLRICPHSFAHLVAVVHKSLIPAEQNLSLYRSFRFLKSCDI